MIKKQTMYLIFDSDRVFRLSVPDEKVLEEMKKDGEIVMEVDKFEAPSMPKLVLDDDGNNVVEWISRADFNAIKFPPAESEEKEEEEDAEMT